jgi:hypothetical protein
MPIVSSPVRKGSCPRDERGATRRAALLPVRIGDDRAFFRNAIDIGRP